jgi:hypothetical protein
MNYTDILSQAEGVVNMSFSRAWDDMFFSMVYLFPVSIPLIVVVILAGYYNCPFVRSRFRRRHLFIFAPLVMTFLICIWGSIGWHENSSMQFAGPFWPWYVLEAILAVQILTGIGVVVTMKGYRWFALAIVLLEQWYGFVCYLIAGMSLPNGWVG